MRTESTSSDDLRRVLDVLRRRALIILACAVVVPLAALGLSLLQQKQYTASSLLLFRDPAFDQQLFGNSVLPQSHDASREAATNVRLVSVRAVADRAAADKEVQAARPGVTGDSIEEKVAVKPQGQADIASVSVTDSNPKFAAVTANIFAQEFIDYRRDADQSTIRNAEKLVQKKLAELPSRGSDAAQRRNSLEKQAEQLGVLASLQTGNAELVQRAEVPSAPSSPRTTRNVVLGFGFGLLLGFGLAFLVERLDRRFRDPKEMEETFERPVLATVPQLRRRAADAIHLETFRMLRANLRYFDLDRKITSLLVTSAAPGDGKTTVSSSLALAAAEAGDRVLLIEADLRRPTLAGRLGHQQIGPGLSALIASDMTVADAVQSVPLMDLAPAASSEGSLDVLFAGPPPPNPIDLLESERMRDIVREAERAYDLVLIDTPPTSVVSDAIPLVGLVSGVIVVSRIGQSTRDAGRRLSEQLHRLNAPILGIVANFASTRDGKYGYDGYYGYAATPPASQEADSAAVPSR